MALYMKVESLKLLINDLREKETFEAIGVGVGVIDTNFRVLYQNSRDKDLEGDHIGEFCYQAYENRETICDGCPLALALNDGQSHTAERTSTSKHGTASVEITASPVNDKTGKIIAGIEIVRDITKRKRAEELLAASEEKYRLIFDNAPLGIFHFDNTGQLTACNQYFADIIGAPIEKVVNFNLLKQLKDTQMKAAAEAALSGSPGHYEGDYLSLVGNKTTPVKADFAPVFSKDWVVIGGMAIFEDISERKQIEQALARSRAEFETMFHAIPEALIMADPDRRVVTINPAFTKLFGYTLDEIKGRTTEFLYENNKDFAQQDRVRHKKSGEGDTSLFEIRYRRKDASIFPAETSGVQMKDSQGTVTGYIAVHRDISERKKAEKRILYERDFSDAALNSLPGIFYVFDRRGKFLRWNRHLEMISEYTPDEIAGMSPLDFFTGKDKSLIQERIQEVFAKGFSDAEAALVSKSGKQTSYYFTGQTIQVEGKTCLIGMGVDITERKKMEHRLEEAAMTDDLTGLLNRRGFYTLAYQQCRVADRTKRGLTLLFVDLDNMKQINDALGHETGDLALKDTADILKKTFRESDIIARMGGDEFAVLITEPSRQGIEYVIMNHLNKNLTAHNEHGHRKYKLSLSMGIANYNPDRPCSVSDLLTRADGLMYEDKKRFKK